MPCERKGQHGKLSPKVAASSTSVLSSAGSSLSREIDVINNDVGPALIAVRIFHDTIFSCRLLQHDPEGCERGSCSRTVLNRLSKLQETIETVTLAILIRPLLLYASDFMQSL